MVRSGIALIELIIAIVVMAIVLMAVPTMMRMSMQSSSVGIQEEAVSLASAQMDTIAALEWDEQNTRSEGYVKILDVGDDDSAPSPFGYGRYPDDNSRYRIGAKTMGADRGQYRRRFEDTERNASLILGSEEGNDPAYFDDIDDYNRFSYSISEQNATGYKFPYTIDINVSYHSNDITDNSDPSGTSNIKVVTLQIHESTNHTDIRFQAFFCNIGETKILIKPIQ